MLFDQWEATGTDGHVVRDHPQHRQPVILCMFNSRKPVDLPCIPMSVRHEYGFDEAFFAQHILPLYKGSIALHDTFGSGPDLPGCLRLTSPPTADDWNYFAGAKIWPDAGLNPDVIESLYLR
jgi:hypothetical protein